MSRTTSSASDSPTTSVLVPTAIRDVEVAAAGAVGVSAKAGGAAVASDARLAPLTAFDRALGRESHNLMGRPDLLWQQLYNRLQWGEDPVPGLLEPQLRRRSVHGATPWLRAKTHLRESEALRLTLAGHTLGVTACAISPDTRFIVTASVDGTGKIWDAATGQERATLTGHTDKVVACAISPDSGFVVSASEDKTCKIWDAYPCRPRLL